VVGRSDEFGRSDAIHGSRGARVQLMSRLLLVVSKATPARVGYFKYLYGSETVEVILDRRLNQRRRRDALPINERRRVARRRRDITEELQTFGWALVRR
jgi:hypothetical protein